MTHADTFFIVSNAVAWAAFIGVVWTAERHPGPRDVWLTVAMIGVLLALGRWPSVFYGQELNIDESQMIAQAMKYRIAPIPWLHIDGTTSGPLNSYWLVPPALLGMPFGYVAARIMGLACVWLFLSFALLTARARVGSRTALLVCAPFVAFLAFTRHAELMHYSSEHLPIALLSAEVYCCSRIITADARSPSNRDRWLVALLAGAIPFTKLQAAPVATGVLMLSVAYDVARAWSSRGRSGPAFIRTFVPYGLGATAAVLFILGPVAAAGSLTDFWISYIRFGAGYGSGVDDRVAILFELLQSIPVFTWFAATMAGLSLAFVLLGALLRSLDGRGVPDILIALVSSACTLLALLLAGRPYPHYQLLLLVPLSCLLLAAVVVSGAAEWRTKRTFDMVATAACLGFVVEMLATRQDDLRAWLAAAQYRMRPAAVSAAGQRLVALARPGDTMAIWGWEPRVFVETGMPPGTRDSVTYGAIVAGPYRNYYLCRYVSDLEQNRPRFFLDVIRWDAFAFNDRRTAGHEAFGPLDTVIRNQYAYVDEIGLPDAGYRLYELRTSAPAPRATAADASSGTCPG